jgi:hypothetical protein
VCQICLRYKALGMSVLSIIIFLPPLTGFKDKDEHGGGTEGHGEGRTADALGRKVRAVRVDWASSGFFDFAQNDGFVGVGGKATATAGGFTE